MHIQRVLILVKYTVVSERSGRHTHTRQLEVFYYLHSGGGVLFDPLDDRLVHQLLGLGVQAVVGQVGHQVVLGHAQDLLLSGHLEARGRKRSDSG